MTFLLGLLSAILIAVAFRAILQLSHSILLSFIFILLFSCAVAIAVLPLLFSLLGLPCRSSLLSAIFNSSCHFYCHAIFIAAVHFVVQPSRITVFHPRLDLLLFGCHFCSGPVVAIFIAAKDIFVVITGCRSFFSFLVVILVIFTPSCSSYRHCSTGSNSHILVLSKPASYSPALFSIPVKRCKHAYQSFMVVYGTGKVRQLCGYSMLVGAVKV